MPFATWLKAGQPAPTKATQPDSTRASSLDEMLRPLDEMLLLVLKMQPSEITELDMDDYWWWTEAAEREVKRQTEAT